MSKFHNTRKILSLLMVVAALVSLPMFATDIYVSSLPLLLKHFGTTAYNIKLSLNIYMVGFALTTLLSGILSEWISKYRILLIGMLLFAFSSFLIANTDSLWMLVVGRGLQGLGAATGTVIARLIIKDHLHEEKGFTQLKALNLVAACMAFSPLIGPFLGAAMTNLLGWQSIFYFLGSIACVLSYAVYRLSKISQESFFTTSLDVKRIFKIYRTVLKNDQFVVPTIAISLACASEFIFVANSPFFYQSVLHFNALAYGLLLSIVLSGCLLGSYLLNQMSKKMNSEMVLHKTVMICSLISFLPFIASLLGNKIGGYALIISTIITMAGVGIIIPLTQSVALTISRALGTSVVGLFFFVEFVAIGLAGYVVSLFNNPFLPMVIGISLCWLGIAGVSSVRAKKFVEAYD